MDFDNDGLVDLVAGDAGGNIWFFKNIGTKTEPKLAAGVKIEADGKEIVGTPVRTEKGPDGNLHLVQLPAASPGLYAKIHLCDWFGDGKLDILVGQTVTATDNIVVYRNIGTRSEPKYAAPVELKIRLAAGKMKINRPSPFVVDWNGDGKKDLLLGSDNGQIYFCRNIGTNEKPQFADPEPITLPGVEKCSRTRISVVDWNGDGKLDLLVGNYYYSGRTMGGHVWLFQGK